MLKYALFKSSLPSSKDKFHAITQLEVTATLDDLIDDMTSRGSTVTRAEVLSIWEEFTESIKMHLRRGENISTPLFYISQDIQGEFASEDDGFDPSRHSVVFNISDTDALKKIADEAKVQKVAAVKPMPIFKSYVDHASGNSTSITSGNAATISGQRLKVDVADPQQGIFIIGNGAETKVTTFIDNQPSTLTFLHPQGLAAGVYQIEVRVKLYRTKDLRVANLGQPLTVQ
jgi:DNA-binding domain/Domain of unknown function (DUF4469) with IG-like fold